MRKINLILFCAATALFMLSACQSEQQAVEAAAYGYLDAMGNYRIKDAEEFASPITIETTLHVIEESIMPATDTNYIKSNTPATIEITDVTLNSDTTATVKYKKTTPIKVQEGELKLVKLNDKWLAEVRIKVPDLFNAPQECEKNARSNRPDTLKLIAVPNPKRSKKN